MPTETIREAPPVAWRADRFTVRPQRHWHAVFATRPLTSRGEQLAPVMITAFNCKKQAERYARLLNNAVDTFFSTEG